LSGGRARRRLQHRLSEAQSERHVARVGLQVVDDSPVDLDGGMGALVLVQQGRGADERQEL